MNDDDGGCCRDSHALQAFCHPSVFLFCSDELLRVTFGGIGFFQWRAIERLEARTDEPQIGNGAVLRLCKRKRMGQKWCARLKRIANAARDTCKIEQRSSPPEIRSQVDGKIILAAPQLPGCFNQQCIGGERLLGGATKAGKWACDELIDSRMARNHLTRPGTNHHRDVRLWQPRA